MTSWRAWRTWLDQLRHRVEQLVCEDDWTIPEDEGVVECSVELVLDGQPISEVTTNLAEYFDLPAHQAQELRTVLVAAQNEHLADPAARAERRLQALASQGKL